MDFTKRIYAFVTFLLCFTFILPQNVHGEEDKETEFRITILKTSGEPQVGMILKINGRSDKYLSNEQGVITFQYKIDKSYNRLANIYFPGDETKAATSFVLKETETSKTIYLDSQEDIASFKQNNKTVTIEGFVKDSSQKPIQGAIISIQGTGRKVLSDEIGLFRIEADYNHPITIRAERMENRSLNITTFLQHPDEPYTVIMYRKNSTRIYSVVEEMPEYPGGMKAFVNYLKRKLVYPPQAKKENLEGVVAVQFVVEKDGRITSPTIVRSLRADMDSAALTAIRNMPNWIPAREHGMRVRCKYSVPVQFKIERPKPAPKKTPLATDTIAAPKDSLGTDSLATDSLKKIVLPGDSLLKDSLRIKPDSLLQRGDSLLLRPDSLTVLNDSLVVSNDSIAVQPTTDQPADKPKKRNIFVRFFRWLFGIKD
ncbi:TonB family protein [Phocaeicola coprocola]|jgi:TonB family protein|uniref:TonB family protein n=2 Tax=Phocaeicola coprocola TaxID=310298 RepID=UPI001C3939CC|nr:TonB family protein [Phocaeicola coprocola]MBV3868412.1 TonB family protein [Phocaeicola coprocola]MBV4009511.1 TonB family protein [Phocaeicola coprocola]MBV4033987.1 TonB family protein [Phocaeicola coprocola]MBV4040583.1 TonB family protein [Phocaeicola coprocola]MBV4062212.1 TonB family protein [Phocaeicola coprocola]